MATSKHYHILRADSLINERQLEELLEQGWVLLQIVPVDGGFYFYFYRN